MRKFLTGLFFAMLTLPASAQFIEDLTCIYDTPNDKLDLNWTDPGTQAYSLWYSANPNADLENNVGSPPDWLLIQPFTPAEGPRSYSLDVNGDYGIFVIASEGEVSNAVGYISFTTLFAWPAVAAATPFGLPFKFWDVVAGVPNYGVESTAPSDILGDQSAPGDAITADKIVRHDGIQAYFNDSDSWVGPLEHNTEMSPGDAYWYVNLTGAPRSIVLAGEIDNTSNYGSTVITAPPVAGLYFATSYSWRDSRNVPVDSLDLLEQGFTGGDVITSDKIVEQVGGGIVNYLTASSEFVGGFTETVPGRAYWLVNMHPGNNWVYTYEGRPFIE